MHRRIISSFLLLTQFIVSSNRLGS